MRITHGQGQGLLFPAMIMVTCDNDGILHRKCRVKDYHPETSRLPDKTMAISMLEASKCLVGRGCKNPKILLVGF